MAAAMAPFGLTSPQDLATALKYGPNTGQALQRSSYLADALRTLTTEGSQNIHSGGELAAKLIAAAILNRNYQKAQQTTMGALATDQKNQLDSAIRGTPLEAGFQDSSAPQAAPQPPSPAPEPVAAPPAPIQAPQPQVQDQAPQAAPQGPSATPMAYSPQDRDALTRMLATEAIGEGPVGMAAAGHVAVNRLKSGYGGAKSLAEIVNQPHQFEGMAHAGQVSPHAYDAAGQVADGILSGQVPDPTGGAMAFLNPDLQTKLGRQMPAWAQGGDGRRIGNHVFFGGNPQLAQNGPAPDPNLAAGINPNIPPPAALTPQAGAPPAAPSSPGIAAGGAAPPAPQAPVQNQQPPHQVVTPDEWKTAFAMAQDWHTRDIGLAEIAKLKMRAAGAVDMKPGTYWGQDGKAHSVEQFTDQPGSPNAIVQRSTLDNSVHAQANPAYGALPSGTVMSPQGGISQVPIQQQPTFTIPGVAGRFVNGPDGRPVKVGEAEYGPAELLKMRDNLLGSEPVKLYQQAADAYGSMVAAAKQNPGGMRAYALRDTFARAINPGAVARVGTIQAIKESQGLPAEIKGFFMNLQGDGNVPPEIAQQILDVTHGFVASHYNGAKQLVDSNVDYAKRHQIDPADVTVPLGDAPQPFRIRAAQQMPAPVPGANAASAAAAEIARRKAAGLWKGG